MRGGGKSDAILGEWVAHATRWGDHAADALRYLCMARPWAGSTEAEYQQQQTDIRNRVPPEPVILVAQPDGTLKANYCMWHVVNRRMREKRM